MELSPKITDLRSLPVTLTVEEVAQILRVSRTAAYNLVATPTFPCVKVGRRIVVPCDGFIRWAKLDMPAA